jgi:hypothetical protein
MAQDAIALRNLADPLFRDVTTGRMKLSRGIVIGRELPANPPAQEAIYRTVRELEDKGQNVSDAKLAELIRIARGSGNVTESQTDLFGTHELTRSLAPQQADILAYVREQLGRDKRLFSTVTRHKGRLAQGGTQVDVGTATGISQGAAARIAALDATAYSSGTQTNRLVREYARQLANSPKGARAGILLDGYSAIYDALEKDFGAQAPLGGMAPQAGPAQGNLLTGQPETLPAPISEAEREPRSESLPEFFYHGATNPEAIRQSGFITHGALTTDPQLARDYAGPQGQVFRVRTRDILGALGDPAVREAYERYIREGGTTVEPPLGDTGRIPIAEPEAAGQGSMFGAPAVTPSPPGETPKPKRSPKTASSDLLGPRRVGGRYFDSYWKEPYTVESINPDGSLTLRWDDGRVTTSRTRWQARDKVIAQPQPSPVRGGPGYTELGATLVPGAKEFAEHNIVPAVRALPEWSRATGDTIRKIIAPKAISREAKIAGEALTLHTSQARENIRLRRRLMAGAKALADDWSPAEQMEFLRRADTRAPQGDPVKQKIAAALYGMLDAKRNELITLGSGALKNWFEDYFPRQWERPEAAHQFFVDGPQRRSLSGPAHFMKRRVLGSFDEGLLAGLTPRFRNPVELVQHTLDDMDRYIAGQRTFAELKGRGYLKLFKPGEIPPAGWERINDKIAKRWRPISTRPELDEPNIFVPAGEWRAMEPVARILNNYTGPSLSTLLAFRGFREVSGFANMLQLGLSAFHLATTAMTAAGSDLARGIELMADGKPLEGLKSFAVGLTPGASLARDVAAGRTLFKYADDPEFRLIHPELARDYQAYINSGAHFDRARDFRSRLWESTRQHLRDHDVIGAALRAPLAAFERLASPLFEYLIPRAKAGAFMDLWRDSLADHPNATADETRDAINRITDSIDNRFGMLNYDRWQLDRRVRDSLFVLLRAPGWTLGNLREFGGGAYDLAHLKLTHRAAGALGLVMAAGWYGALYQWAHTGTWPDLSPAAHGDILGALRNLLAPHTGRTNADGTPERVILPGLHKDLVSMLFQAGAPLASGDVVGAAQGMGSFFGAKANPVLAIARSLYLNRDFYGREITDRAAPLPVQLGQMAANVGGQLMPFSQQSYERRKEEAGRGAAVESALGVMPASRYVTDTADERFLRAHVVEGPPLTPAQAERRDAMRKLEAQIRRGQRPNVGELLRTGKLTMHDLPQLLRRARMTPLESLLSRASLDDAFAAAKLAPPEHLPIYREMLRRKLANALRTHSIGVTQAEAYANQYRALMGLPPFRPLRPPARPALPPPGPATTPSPMARNFDRLNAERIAGNNPERRDEVAKLSRNLRGGKTPDVNQALRSGRLSMPCVETDIGGHE